MEAYKQEFIDFIAFWEDLKNTIPIYFSEKRPRIGTIMKNHI